MIMVTGGAGYIGSFTVRELLKNNYGVLVVDNLVSGSKAALAAASNIQQATDSKQQIMDGNLILEVADVGDRDAMRLIFDKYEVEAVIDFAAYLAVGESMSNPRKYLENNVLNFINLLDVMKEKGCKYIIKSSTAATYGNPEDKHFPLGEDYQEMVRLERSDLLEGEWDGERVSGEEFFGKFIDYYEEIVKERNDIALNDKDLARLRIPTSIYGLTKMMDEILMEKYQVVYGFRTIALRYFNVCGASEDGNMGDNKLNPTNLMTMVIFKALGKTDVLKVFGDDYPTRDGTGLRDYIHPIDLAKGHVGALQYVLQSDNSGVFNLGTGDGYTVLEVITAVEEASGKKINYEVVPRRSGDPAVSYSNSEKSRNVLKWRAEYALDEMARTAWLWHSANPEGYK